MQSVGLRADEFHRVVIDPKALRVITDESLRSLDGLETGGILLGHDERAQIGVVHAGDPGPAADRRRDRFLRDLAHAKTLAERGWMEDGSQWIGEWHTHPNGELAPSSADLRSYLRHLADPELRFTRFLAIIVTITMERIAVAAWVIYPNRLYAAEIVSRGEG